MEKTTGAGAVLHKLPVVFPKKTTKQLGVCLTTTRPWSTTDIYRQA